MLERFKSFGPALAVAFVALTAAADPAPPSHPLPGQFVVKLAPRANAASLRTALADGERLEHPSPFVARDDLAGADTWNRIYVLNSADSTLTAEDVEAMLGSGNVEYVEPVYTLDFYEFPTDDRFDQQWYLHNTGQAYPAVIRRAGPENDTLGYLHGTPGEDIGIVTYYENAPDTVKKVVVAVVDTGVDPDHPELRGKYWHNPDEIPDNGLDDDHNGYVDDVVGYDISGDSLSLYDVPGDNDPSDYFGHGTHIAGIVAAAYNGFGVVGVSPKTEIMAVKIRPNATTTIGALGVVYAVNAGAEVVNISWGTPFEALVLEDALDLAEANGVLVCVSAGNSGDDDIPYPAAFENAFTVGASDAHGYMTDFSNYGPELDLCAPGENILSLRAAGTDMYATNDETGVHIIGDDSLYYLADGTSMSAPMVAGAAAFIWSIKPHLTLEQLANSLRLGARDMLDPLNVGDYLPGADSISGYGLLDIRGALALQDNGGLYFVDPVSQTRRVGDVAVRAASVGSYTGGWALSYALSSEPDVWHELASGATMPSDSILYTFTTSEPNGHIILKLVDDYEIPRFLRFIRVSGTRLELSSPQDGQEYDYNIPVEGWLYGPDLDSAVLFSRRSGETRTRLDQVTGEFFDSLIYGWNASGIALGQYSLIVEGYFGTGMLSDSIAFTLASAFAEGWPRTLTGRGSYTAAAADLDGDGTKEVIVGTNYGLNVFHHDGQPVDGFPALMDQGARSIPAVYDVDRDGLPEIICTTDSGLYVVNGDGTMASGWPALCYTGNTGMGHPAPGIAQLDASVDSAIVIINGGGDILAYRFDGKPYFYSLEGWYASFNGQTSLSQYAVANSVTAADLNGDDVNEVVAFFSSQSDHTGVAAFDARTGQPAWGHAYPYLLSTSSVTGTVLGDFNHDGHTEILVCGTTDNRDPCLWLIDDQGNSLSGWPRVLTELHDWIPYSPTVADLDLDGSPELIATFSEYNIGVIYVFRLDGSPYLERENRPAGEAYVYAAMLGSPVVANLTGDEHPEIAVRSGYLFPGTGRERVHVLDYLMNPVPGWPVATPAIPSLIFSTPFTPMVDDLDGDGLVELIFVSEGMDVCVWNFDASSDGGRNSARLFRDNLNSGRWVGDDLPTDVEETPAQLPGRFTLRQNYPNPFNPTTVIAFDLPTRSKVRLDVFNVLGQRVANLIDRELPAGSHETVFDGDALASGVYFYRLKTDDNEQTRKMVLIK